MDWTRSHPDSPEIEEILQFPELPLDDVERILFLSDGSIHEACEYEEQEQLTPLGPASVSSSGYCSEFTGSDNISLNCEEIKEEEMGQTPLHHHVDPPLHMKYGVLNINIKKFIDSEKESSANLKDTRDILPLDISESLLLSQTKRPHIRTSLSSHSRRGYPISNIDNGEDPKCNVCTKPALRFSSYGGLVCSSCRSFFRRSAQTKNYLKFTCKRGTECAIDPGTRKNCQYCRFQLCIRSGMKITWVLSEQERDRRFKKCANVNIPSVLGIPFSPLEEKTVKDLNFNLHVPWLKHFFMLDKHAAVNLMDFVYGEDEFRIQSWDTFKKSMSLDFVRHILPMFKELEDLSPHDLGQILHSHNSGNAHFFRISYWIDIGSAATMITCPVLKEMKALSMNPDLVKSLEIEDLMTKLDLSKDPSDCRRPSYNELYPTGWARDQHTEIRHREAIHKIVHWPSSDKNKFDRRMIGLLTFIVLFNADFYTLQNRDRVEKIQMKYIMVLQRYLRSRMSPEAANTKFLEAMMLISHTRQAFEITCEDETDK